MSRAAFIDRDNTIILNDGYLGDPAGVRLVPQVGTGLRRLMDLGFMLITVSNQAGVAHGMFTEEDVERVNAEMCRQLAQQGATIERGYSCFHHPKPKTTDGAILAKYKGEHPWRKPSPGMLLQAARDFGLNFEDCWMIGDSLKDVEAGQAAGCRTLLIRDPSIIVSPDADKGSENTEPDIFTESWLKVPELIERADMMKTFVLKSEIEAI